MFHSLKRFWFVLALLAGGTQSMWGFALLGPGAGAPNAEAYQIQSIGYNLPAISAFGDAVPVDVGTPKNFGQGYRWNTPTNYYAFDASFATFFGANGMAAVDRAFTMFNSLSNVSAYSHTLSEWPINASRANPNAEASGLLDVKSTTMEMMIEQLGLASPDRWTWALHDRFLPTGATCPDYEYFVIQRNFDPITQVYSSYVNDQLLGYSIFDFCGLNPNTFAPLNADAQEYTTDPKKALSAVASFGLAPGVFFTGFTRDDIGGLRYLYAATNVFNEPGDSNSVVLVTNTTTTVPLTTSNLAIFEEQALTNDPTTLSNLYPGLIITSTTNFFTNVVTTNFSFQLVSVPQSPAGTFTLTTVVTLTTNLQQLFYNTYANVVILHSGGLATKTIQQTSVTPAAGSSADFPTFVTNIVSTVVTTPFTNGDFYILPAGQCGPDVILNGGNPALATLTSVTNVLPVVILANTGTIPQFFVFNEVTTFTNFTYLVNLVNCGTNTVAVRQGIEHLTFIRRDFDPLLGTTWDPITNFYHLTAVTNVPIVQTLRRIVTQPDILFTTGDLLAGPEVMLAFNEFTRSTPNFNSVATGQPGPGTIAPGVVFTFNDVGPFFENGGPYFKAIGGVFGAGGTPDTNSLQSFQWGSFDGSTNAPILYPSSASLADLEAELYFQVITPSPLPAGKVGNAYGSVQLEATGATQFLPPKSPYLWNTNVPGLTPGLTLSATGILSGTPTTVGTNQFTVQVTDAGQRTTSKLFQIGVTQ